MEQDFQTALSLLKQHNALPSAIAETHLGRAWLYVKQRNYSAALADWTEAQKLSKTESWPGFRWLVRAEIARGTRDFPSAHQAFQKAMETARLTGAPASDIGWRALYGVGSLHLAEGQRRKAIDTWKQALGELDLTTRQIGVDAIGGFLGDRQHLTRDLMEVLIEAGQIDEAVLVADRSRAHTLQALDAQHRLERLTPAQMETWSTHIQSYMQLRSSFDPTAESHCLEVPRDEVAACEAKRQQRTKALTEHLDAAYALLDEAAGSVHSVSRLSEIQQALRPKEALLVVASVEQEAQGQAQWRSFWVTHSTVEAGTPSPDPASLWLSRLPALDHLFLVGDAPSVRGLSARLDTDEQPLGAKVQMSELPFAGLLTRRDKPTNTGAPLVIADPTRQYQGALLAGDIAARHVPDARRLDREAATRAPVLDGLTDASVFHFSGHAEQKSGDPWTGALLLAGQTSLTASDVLIHRPQVGLAVLAACGTGAGHTVSGDDTLSLAEAFIAAGSQTVIATDRAIEAEAAERFAKAFYGHGGAQKPAEAFRKTLRDLHRQGDPHWAHWRLLGFPHSATAAPRR
ncbi:MAG: CHAT domain-containing protein [Bradymonadia bacterium]